MRRRGFICSLAVGGIAPALPTRALAVMLPAIPILYGDGVHDDAAALEAALNGESVNWQDGTPVGDVVGGKTFMCRRQINIGPEGLKRSLIDNRLMWPAESDGGMRWNQP